MSGVSYQTLARKDQQFSSYLLGTFSPHKRALPVDGFFYGTSDEKITFQIVSLDEINRPFWGKILWVGFRPALMPLTLGTALSVICLGYINEWVMRTGVVFSSLMALICWHGMAFLLNDYLDHYSGRDLRSNHRGSRIIQKGWMTAHQVLISAKIFGGLGVLLGVPSVCYSPDALLVVGVMGLLAILGFSFLKGKKKYRGWGLLLVFFGMGPLLTLGLSLALFGQFNFLVLNWGVLFGLTASLCIQLRNLETILVDFQSRSPTVVNRLGFDKSKWWILGHLLLVLMLFTYLFGSLTHTYAHGMKFLGIGLLPFVSAISLGIRLYLLKSPLSSHLNNLWREGVILHLLMIFSLYTLLCLSQWLLL